MNGWAKQKSRGFSLVELLIVIVVIAVLASISVVAYNGIQTRAQNTAAANELLQWQKIFTLYKSNEGDFPPMALGGYCLGSGFPLSSGGVPSCRNYGMDVSRYVESDNAELMAELSKHAQVPSSRKFPVGPSVGPYALFEYSRVKLVTVIKGHGACPEGTINGWSGSYDRQQCEIILPR